MNHAVPQATIRLVEHGFTFSSRWDDGTVLAEEWRIVSQDELDGNVNLDVWKAWANGGFDDPE